MAEDRFITPAPVSEEVQFEATVRPRLLSEYIGQAKIKDNLSVFIGAAKERREALDHVLLYGPPGLGKTTLAHILANEMGVAILATSGPALEKSGDLAAILTNLEERGVLFIDEIHRMNKTVEEVLYPAMEDFHIDIIIGKGPGARSVKLSLPRFTLVGATTRMGLLSSPFRDRFGVVFRLDFYNRVELTAIVIRTAGILQAGISPEAAGEIASRSRGTPRIANRLLRRARDFAQVEGDGTIDLATARHTLERLEVDGKGLDQMDRKVLLTLMDKFSGGPVGIETLSAAVGEERDTIEDIYEPFLLQEGLLARTPRGRVATEAAYRHFGKNPPANSRQPELFGK